MYIKSQEEILEDFHKASKKHGTDLGIIYTTKNNRISITFPLMWGETHYYSSEVPKEVIKEIMKDKELLLKKGIAFAHHVLEDIDPNFGDIKKVSVTQVDNKNHTKLKIMNKINNKTTQYKIDVVEILRK